MPDVTMCDNSRCPNSLNCYRFVAKPNQFRQSYFQSMAPDASGKCNHFWQADPNEIADYNARKDREEYWEEDNESEDSND